MSKVTMPERLNCSTGSTNTLDWSIGAIGHAMLLSKSLTAVYLRSKHRRGKILLKSLVTRILKQY